MLILKRYKTYITNIDRNIIPGSYQINENCSVNQKNIYSNEYYKGSTANINLVTANGRDFIFQYLSSISYYHYMDAMQYDIVTRRRKCMNPIYISSSEVLCLGEKCIYTSVELRNKQTNLIHLKFNNVSDHKLDEIMDIFTKIYKYKPCDLQKTTYKYYINGKYLTTNNDNKYYIQSKVVFSLFD